MSIGDNGIIISGAPMEGLEMVAGLKGKELGAGEASTVLYTLGMSKEASLSAVSTLIHSDNHELTVYGVSNDYVNVDNSMQKEASIKNLLGEYAKSIKVNLVKEAASLSDDPETVDRMLSLDFINEDNVKRYAENISEFEETADKISEMLIASRLGMKDVDEGAAKKAVEGITNVIEGLKKLNMTVKQ
jgi:hypothetical protein